ncbi:MAG: hypothetical protein IPN53_25050 [Comamonadaceae bacterium]|nr:hypothetical protein [Comamonadaceae bacterium]
MKFKGLISALALVVSSAVFAQANAPVTPVLDQKQANQQQRIDQGVASGQLNKREARRLQAREDKLAAQEAAAKSDGVVTKKERVRLNAEANRDSRAIYRQKHDRQKVKVAP